MTWEEEKLGEEDDRKFPDCQDHYQVAIHSIHLPCRVPDGNVEDDPRLH